MKSVTFDPYVMIFTIPAEESTNKMVVPEKQNRSYARIDLEIKQRKSQAKKIAKQNIANLRHSIAVYKEAQKNAAPEDAEYFKTRTSECIFELKLWKTKIRQI
ncbi:hypothetical protein PBCVNEJV1_194L [Paramecium bursaria Chlorella virus NE-JV-1]|nr:hypothetical protein PBCVNEJV1_194L [Paramecium bursaria Chlorella virus NE-JV-1]